VRARPTAPRTGIHEEILEEIIEINGRPITIRARRHGSARRITLRIDAREGCAILTLPARTSLAKGIGFAREKADWLTRKLADLPPLTPFEDDAVIPFKGDPVLIRHFPLAGPSPVLTGGVLHIPGTPGKIAEAVRDWLKIEARAALTDAAAEKAREISRPPPEVNLTDPRTRWGSCSAKGRLSFSWRLIMAPTMVLDYVAAHEVAHLVHLNHGPGFKDLLSGLAARQKDARAWLASEGTGLHRYG
jgi:predicted metal-dependent hydrolase